MSYNQLGLKELRFINSGHFPHERIIIDDFTLLLGSSGVGKTTVMSAICYFYTMDKFKTRPIPKEKTFYDWHIEGSYSHLIYVYENKIGKNLLLLSKEDGKSIKHIFINIHNFQEDISILYLDENNRSLNLKEILSNCLKHGLTYYKSETVPTFRKMMCRKSYKMLPSKDKPELDFSLYDSEESASLFGKYLFNIYSNSSVRDRGIKDMLISLIGEKEYSLDISSFKHKLDEALKNVEHFELIKKRRDKILELDENIVSYRALCSEIDKTVFELETMSYNKDRISEVIETKHLDLYAQEKIETEKSEKLSKEWDKKSTNYNDQIAELNKTIKSNETTYNKFIDEYKIERLIEENSKQNKYEEQKKNLEIKVVAISSSLEELDTKEETEKQKERISLNSKKEEEKIQLEEKKEQLAEEILQLSKDKEVNLKNSINAFDEEIEVKTAEYNQLDKKISEDDTTLRLLPSQKLESNASIKFEKEINRLITLKDSIESNIKVLESEKLELEKQRDASFDELNKKIQDEISQYSDNKSKVKEKIELVNKKLDIGKNNLFGFLNKNEVPNKRKILAIANDEILFEEKNFTFSLETSNDNFYGLVIDGDIETIASKYDIETLENNKTALQKQLNELVSNHTVRYKRLEDNLKSSSNKFKKLIKEKSREIYDLSPRIKDYEIKIANEQRRLDEEIARLKDENDKRIIETKKQLLKDKERLTTLKEYISTKKRKKDTFIQEINAKYVEKEKDLNAQFSECKNSIKLINKKYENLVKDSDKRIHEIYNEIKRSQNIDTDELDSYHKTIKQLTKTIKEIQDNRGLVKRYTDEVLPNYNQIPLLREQLAQIDKQRTEDKDYYEKELRVVGDVLKQLEDSINIWKSHAKSFKDFKNALSQFEITSNINYDSYIEEEVISLLNTKQNITLLERYKTLEIQQDEKEKTIKLDTRRIVDDIPSDNMMKLKSKSDINSFDDNIEQYIVITKSYADFIKTKFDIEGTSLQLHILIETINDAVSKISHIKGTFDSIVKDVNKINSTINDGIINITVIDFIKLNFRNTGNDEIVSRIENIGDMLSANMLIGYENSERSESVKDELVKIAQDLQIILERTFKKNITVSDISTLTFDVSENNQVTKGIATLDNIGSNGTSIMVKAIIYITLLRMVTKKSANSENIKYHCIIDEIGQISADYFTELMNYAKLLDFVFINGTAANDDDIIDAYPRIYMGTRESSNHVELSLIDAQNAMDEW
ncbi:ATP-binding protein [Malaciobacter canalis]|uniref:ATP-binding protein n=1 Tax=Malaciobacter canalis TaxID=1912871 RepID=UPI00384B650C